MKKNSILTRKKTKFKIKMFKQLNTAGKKNNLKSTHLRCLQLKIHTLTTLYCEQHTLGLQHNVMHDKVK